MKKTLLLLTLTGVLMLSAAAPGTLRFKGNKGSFELESCNTKTEGSLFLLEKDKKTPLPLKFTIIGSSIRGTAEGIVWMAWRCAA